MKNITRIFLLSGLAILALAAVACSSGENDTAAGDGDALPAASLPVNTSTTIEPTEPDAAVEEPGELTSITILDTLNLDECDFIHAINACFTEGAMPADINPGEVMDVYFQAREMLAGVLSIDPSSAKIASIERVEWPDSSLGVPEPGTFYIQVITPGFKMVMELEGKQYVFHTSTSRVVPEQPIK